MKVKDSLPTLRKSDEKDDHPFYSLQRQINNLFDDFFSGFTPSPRGFNLAGSGGFSPSVEVRENEKEFIIRAELPGVDEKNIEVTLTSNSLTIQGEKKEEKEDKAKNYHYMERSYGSFRRVIPLDAEIKTDKAEANFKNGVLNITLPKAESSKVKGTKVPIKAA